MANYANQTTRLIAQSLPVFPTQTSFTQLFGDTFASTPASSLYLLEDLQGTGAGLDNPNGVTFDEITDLIISPVNVGTFDGTNQFLSTPTAVANQVGIGSFVASIWFKTTIESGLDTLFMYGNTDTNEQNWEAVLTSGKIQIAIDDGTTLGFFTDTKSYGDGKWHIMSMVVDRTPAADLMYLLVDGELRNIGGTDISAVTGTLDNVGTNLYIGARAAPTVGQTFEGQLANFSLYIADAASNTVPPDYNLPSLLDSGLRESATVGTIASPTNDSSLRINNKFIIPSVIGNYSTSTINTSEGIYDIITIEETGTPELSIDGNIITETTGIYFTAGTHILKYENTLTSLLQFAAIELIKREGANEEDNEATSGVLFGDEINQRSNNVWTFATNNGEIYNNRISDSSSATGEFLEGDLFLKKGDYKITITSHTFIDRAAFNLYFGGVKVLDEDTTWNGVDTANVQKTVFAFLEGGKTTVRWETGSTAGGSFNLFNSIKFELVSGKSNGDDVNIWGADDDFQIVNGALDLNLVILTSWRFNFERVSGGTVAVNDEWLYNRYFSGGTYKVRYLYAGAANRAILDIFSDNNSTTPDIFDNFDASISLVPNSQAFVTVTLSRGFHDIHFKAVANGGGGVLVSNQNLQFTKIAEVLTTEDEPEDIVYVSNGTISATPTISELTALFGLPTEKPQGWSAIADDDGLGSNVWKIWIANGIFFMEQLEIPS